MYYAQSCSQILETCWDCCHLFLYVGGASYSSTCGSVAVRGILPRCPEHGQHEHPGTHAGLWSIRLHGQVSV